MFVIDYIIVTCVNITEALVIDVYEVVRKLEVLIKSTKRDHFKFTIW